MADCSASEKGARGPPESSATAANEPGVGHDDTAPIFHTPPTPAAVYYGGGYWNEFAVVKRAIERRITGEDPDIAVPVVETVIRSFSRAVGGRRFRRGLFINCGNGRVERMYHQLGVIESGVGLDNSAELLADAKRNAGDAPLDYYCCDVNDAAFPPGPYDLIVNHAAAHHVTYMDRVLRALREVLAPDGYVVCYDYVGPHRNQYDAAAWDTAERLNARLPESARQRFGYPQISDMLAADPTEAVHSELILPTFRRYFTVDDFRPVGGALAYPLLTHNAALCALPAAEAESIAADVIRADGEYLETYPDSTLFAFWYGRGAGGHDDATLARWELEENDREARAHAAGGYYYPAIASLRHDPHA